MECIKIDSLEHVPEDGTLLVHYTIDCTGTWDLSQLSTAYRNVCEDMWTIMYPDDQNPQHSDFPVRVGAGGFAGTFAWKYDTIRGLTAETFDSEHSYLLQLTIFNLDCGSSGGTGNTGGGQTGGGGGNTGSGPGGRLSIITPVPGPVPGRGGGGGPPNPNPLPLPVPPSLPPPAPNPTPTPAPATPSAPDTPSGRRGGPITPGPILPPLPPPVPPRSGSYSGDLIQRRPVMPIIEDEARYSHRDAPPFTTRELFHRDSWTPINTVGMRDVPTLSRSSRTTYSDFNRILVNRTGADDFLVDDRQLNGLSDNNSLFTVDKRTTAAEDPPTFSTSLPLLSSSEATDNSQRFYLTQSIPEQSDSSLLSIPKNNILAGATICLEIGNHIIRQGEKFVASSVFHPLEGQEVTARMELYLVKEGGDSYLLLGGSNTLTSYSSPLSLAGTFNSSFISSIGYIISVVKNSSNQIIAVASKEVRIVPQQEYTSRKQAVNGDSLPQELLRAISSSEDNRTEVFMKANSTLSLIVDTSTSTSPISALINTSTNDQFIIQAFDIEGVSDEDLTVIEMLNLEQVYIGGSSSRYSVGGVQVYVESNNCTLLNLIKDTALVRVDFKPAGQTSKQQGFVYFDSTHSLRDTTHTVSSFTGSTATITLYLPYANRSVRLIVNGKNRGYISDTSSTYTKTTGPSGKVTFTSVAITNKDWFSIVLEVDEKYNIHNNLIYEGQIDE